LEALAYHSGIRHHSGDVTPLNSFCSSLLLLLSSDLHLLPLSGVFIRSANPWALLRFRICLFFDQPDANLHRVDSLHAGHLDSGRKGFSQPNSVITTPPPLQVLNLLLHINSRANEFAADAYANQLGMGEGLCTGLVKISVGE
jgi:hypothetical protein